MRVAPATLDDVWFVLKNAHPWHTAEIEADGYTIGDILGIAASTLETAECLHLDGKPACVVGYQGPCTWFLATSAYYAGGLKVLRHAKQYWTDVAKRREVLSVVLDRPELLRWLGWLGFKELGRTKGRVLLRLASTKPTDCATSSTERA